MGRPAVERAIALLPVAGPTLVAAILRLTWLDADSLWHDEVHTALGASRGVVGALRVAAENVHPPLYYVLTALLGDRPEWVLRMPAALAGIATVALVAAAGRRVGGDTAAWVAGLWLALLPAHVHWSQEARSFTLLGLLFAGVLCAQEIWRRPVIAGWCAALALYTHGLAPVLLVGPVAIAVMKRDWRSLAAFGLAAIAFLPWLDVAVAQEARFSARGGYPLDLPALGHELLASMGPGAFSTWLAPLVGLVVAIVAAIGGVRPQARGVLGGAGISLVALLVVAVLFQGFLAKHVFVLAPVLALGLGAAVAWVPDRRWRWGAGVLTVVVPIAGLVAGGSRLPVRPDLRSVVHAVLAARTAPAPIFAYEAPAWRYYTAEPVRSGLGLGVDFDATTAHQGQREAFAGRADQVWWSLPVGAGVPIETLVREVQPSWLFEAPSEAALAVDLANDLRVPVMEAELEGPVREAFDQSLAFYWNGRAVWRVVPSGEIAVWCTASTTGRATRLEATLGSGAPVTLECDARLRRQVVGMADGDSGLVLEFRDDYAGDEGDRNVWVWGVVVGQPRVVLP